MHASLNSGSIPDIFLYQGRMVIPDYELAHYYGVQTDRIHRAFRAHEDLFPGNIVFSIDSKKKTPHTKDCNSRKETLLFTEQSAALLAGLIKSSQAVKANMRLMRVFRLLDYITAV